MRIIGGKYRSRVLADFAGQDVRPTSDRARESLFNILSMKVLGARVLDLFCGSGALGLESLSRGAKEAVFNDVAKDSLAIVRKNLETLKIDVNGGEATVSHADYSVCLESVRGQFDIIKEVLSAMGFGVLSLTGYEADDILGTLSSQCAARDLSALLRYFRL